MMSEVLTKFCNFTLWQDEVHWFNAESYGTHRQVQVCITPLSIAPPLLVEAVFKKLDTVVCTSATLDLNDEFAFWSSRVGLPYDEERPFLKGAFSSPFDYKNRLLLLTPSDAPLYSKDKEEAYEAYLTDTIMSSVLSAGGGGVLVLFTSYSMLKKVHQSLSETFEKEGLTLLCQGGEYDRYTLLNRFISEKDSVLFATSSFWEGGVDAPGGETLRMVIIVKLPFTVPPSDPVFKARCEAIDANGGGSGSTSLPCSRQR